MAKGRRGQLWNVTLEAQQLFGSEQAPWEWYYNWHESYRPVKVIVRKYSNEYCTVMWPSEVKGKMYLQRVQTCMITSEQPIIRRKRNERNINEVE